MNGRKKIAAILTTCFTRSHAEVILPKLIKGFPTGHGMLEPQVDLASIYLDQIHEEDVCAQFAREHGIPIYPSIIKALTLGGARTSGGRGAYYRRTRRLRNERKRTEALPATRLLRAGLSALFHLGAFSAGFQRQTPLLSLGTGQVDVRPRS